MSEPEPAVTPAPDSEQAGILTSSAVMAAGTIVSRLSGFVRSTLLAAALGLSLHADIFTIANTVPNMLYILLAGGVFNAVLVPQLVRAMKNDPDGGEAYTNRVVTLAALFLGLVTVLLIVAAPIVMSVYLDGSWGDASLAEQRQSVIDFARFCLPQVFFYGMFVLVGQILNSRGRFGPMMWAPIANNVISVAVLVIYLVAFGPARGDEATGAFDSGQELLLGLGATVGIAAQLLILVPYLKSAGFTYRPRFDFLHTGLGHTLRLGIWTVLFVIVNQIAYTVVIRLASGGTTGGAGGAGSGVSDATGPTVYAAAFLIVMVPHSVITVSLTTAILPRLSQRASDGELDGLAHTLSSTLRTALTVVIPFAALLPIVAPDIANVVWGHAAGRLTYDNTVPTLSPVRRGRGLLHGPLPDAARVLCARADAHRVLDPVLGGDHQHRRCTRPGGTHRRRAHGPGSGDGLHGVVRRGVDRVLLGVAATARRPGDARARRVPRGPDHHHGRNHCGRVRGRDGRALADRTAALDDRRRPGCGHHCGGRHRLPLAGPAAAAAGGHLGDRSGEAADSGRTEALTVLR